MLDIKVDSIKRKEALDKIEQDRIKFEEECKLRVLNSYKEDVDSLINELRIGYEDMTKKAYECGDNHCNILFKDTYLLSRINKIKYINDHKLFKEVFPPFISSIGGYTPLDIDYDSVANYIMKENNIPYNSAKRQAYDCCSGVTLYFKEL
ncbi:MAG: hypothetical protein ACRCXT_09795 [Paraclostridium sp.]